MKPILSIIILMLSFQCFTQNDTMKVYHDNGQLRILSPRLNGQLHGVTKTWYETGIISALTTYKLGRQLRVVRFNENGMKNYFSQSKKWKTKIKMWHPNGSLWVVGKSRYWRSFEKEIDSTGFWVKKVIEKRGSSLSCFESISEDESDTLNNPTANCICPWGQAKFENNIWKDEKGRDLTSKYKYHLRSFYTNGQIREESIIDNKHNINTTRKFDENGTELFDLE